MRASSEPGDYPLQEAFHPGSTYPSSVPSEGWQRAVSGSDTWTSVDLLVKKGRNSEPELRRSVGPVLNLLSSRPPIN